jgi:hypothetical protein
MLEHSSSTTDYPGVAGITKDYYALVGIAKIRGSILANMIGIRKENCINEFSNKQKQRHRPERVIR